MCGRYASSKDPQSLVAEFDAVELAGEVLGADYNVAPTKDVYAVIERLPRSTGTDTGADPGPTEAQRKLKVVRWGLVPSWAKDPSVGNRMINARAETLAEKPAFKRAFAKRRCILPADGFYEWYSPDEPGAPRTRAGKPLKQPYFITDPDGRSLPMAGLYELWRDAAEDAEDPDAWLWTATVITTTATDDLGRIHDRAPMLVDAAHRDRWLDPAVTDVAELTDLLVPAAPGRLVAYPVTTAVNDVKNNGPELIDPLPAEHPDAIGEATGEQLSFGDDA
jgi:putative SOS response-associated peptidase YedK